MITFQRIFNLAPDGVVGKATWYKMVYLYTGILQLAELVSQGQNFVTVQFQYAGPLTEGDSGPEVGILQYMLALLAQFDDSLSPMAVDALANYYLRRDTVRAQSLRENAVPVMTGGLPGEGPGRWDDTPRMGQYQGRPLEPGQRDGQNGQRGVMV